MRKQLQKFCLLVGAGLIFLLTITPLSAAGHLTILMYHRFDAGGSISIPMDQFKRQINYLMDNNYRFQSLESLIDHLETGRPFPEKSVMITVDDGYKSTYTKAYPFLKEKGIPWVLYVYTQSVEAGYPSALSWKMIKEMAKSGVPVENHTYSHGKFIHMEDKNDTWVRKEILEPARLIEQKTGQANQTISIPYGMYDTPLLQVIKESSDYPFVMASDPGVVDPTAQPYILNRFGINRSTNWSEFLQKLDRLPLAVEKASPVPGARFATAPETIYVDLEEPEKLDPGRINVFISEFGAMNWSWLSREEGKLAISVDAEFSRPWNRLIITAFDRKKGKYRYYSQGLVYTAD